VALAVLAAVVMELGIQILPIVQPLRVALILAVVVAELMLGKRVLLVVPVLSFSVMPIAIRLQQPLDHPPMQILAVITFIRLLAAVLSSSTKVRHGTLC
jgi:hypothetical protein